MSTTSETEKAAEVLAEMCRSIRSAHTHSHVSLIISVAQHIAPLVVQGHLAEEQMRTAMLEAAANFIADRQCACTQASIEGHIDSALRVAK